MPVKASRPYRALAAAGVVAFVTACGGTDQPATPNTPPADARRVDPSTAASITGRVLIDGPVPQNPTVQMQSDPVCARAHKDGVSTIEVFTVHDDGLEDVFVYLKDGLDNYYFETPTEPVKVDQAGCRYVPHVFGVRAGQPIEFSNSDGTAHNVHALATANREFNFTQAMAGMRNTRTFTVREVMVRLKCDVHPWMSAYAGVMDHPYFAVTANGGRFELKNLPPGTYTLEAWHEKLGTQSQQVTLGEKDSKEVTFSFPTS